MKRFLLIGMIVCGLTTFAAANDQIETVEFSDSIGLMTTNWNSMVTVPKFDPSLGTLLSIDFTLNGHVEGTAMYESLDAAASVITLDLQAEIELQRPDNSTIGVVIPVVQVIDNATAHDGMIDFDGSSGGTFPGLMGNDSDTFSSPPPASDLVDFTGPGTIDLPVIATGASVATGAGNIVSQFNTSASAEVTVIYTYKVPEPGTLSLLGLGALTLLRRRRA